MFIRQNKFVIAVAPVVAADAVEAAIVPGMPQTVDAPAPVSTTAKSSRTVSGGLVALFATVGAFFKDSISVIMDASGQIDILSPVMKITGALGITTERAMFALGVAAVALVLYARLDDAHRGNVK